MQEGLEISHEMLQMREKIIIKSINLANELELAIGERRRSNDRREGARQRTRQNTTIRRTAA